MISAFYVPILALIFLGLTYWVIMGRFKYRVSLGDGSNEALQKRIRAHGNFAEFVPFAVILLILVEMTRMPVLTLHIAYIVLIIARLLHIVGIVRPPINYYRMIGVIGTHLVMLWAGAMLLWYYLAAPSI